MGKIISISNQKGGTGKTTLAANLAVLWSNSEYNVAIVDADAQKSLSMWIQSRKEYYGEDDIGMDIIKYNPHSFSDDVKSIKKNYDYVIVDSPPSITFETIQLVKNSDKIIVPLQATPLDLMATIPFLNIVKRERKNSSVVLNRILPRVNLTEAMLIRLRYAGAKISRSKITSRVIFAETFLVGRGVVDISISSDSAKEIINLGNEIIRNL